MLSQRLALMSARMELSKLLPPNRGLVWRRSRPSGPKQMEVVARRFIPRRPIQCTIGYRYYDVDITTCW